MFLNKVKDFKQYLLMFLKWSLLSALMGVLGGLLGAVFHHALEFVTEIRQASGWLIFLLPVGGLAIVGLYWLLRLRSNRGTNEIVNAVLEGKAVSPLIAPAVFLSTVITHLFGGSSGREGAALQIGGSMASLLNKLFRLKKDESTMMIICGMGAVFSGLFSMPLTACLFALEFESVGTIFSPALLPCFIASLVANVISSMLGVHPIVGVQIETVEFTFSTGWRFIVLAVLVALLGIGMCYTFHKASHLAQRWIDNPAIRILAGACVVVALTLLVGDQRFNGAGVELTLQAINGTTDWYSFIVKLLFTAVTLAAGFKGREIVPTFCIGATFGCLIGGWLGLPAGFAAMLGLVGLFCAVTNSPLASIVLSVEMFGVTNLYIFALICVITFALSGNFSLYDRQTFEFSKFSLIRKPKDREEEI